MPSSIPSDHWSRHLKTDAFTHILSFLDEDAMVRWEVAEGKFQCCGDFLRREMLYVESMNKAIARQWKNLYNAEKKRRHPRWANHNVSCVATSGQEYVKECRRARAVVAEARKFYDFHGKAGVVAFPSVTGDLEPDIVVRRIPLQQSDDDNATPSLSWNEWTIPTHPQTVVFVTITKIDTQDFWQGYRSFDYLSSTPHHFQGKLTLGRIEEVAKDLEWPDLKETLQIWDSIATKMDALKVIMENMQITVTTCGEENGVVISTGGFDSVEAVFGGRTRSQFHERHPESPMADRVQGVMNSLDVKMYVENGELKFDLVRQIDVQIEIGHLINFESLFFGPFTDRTGIVLEDNED
jgi:hypothetical protein